jgi:hypothetical protein
MCANAMPGGGKLVIEGAKNPVLDSAYAGSTWKSSPADTSCLPSPTPGLA